MVTHYAKGTFFKLNLLELLIKLLLTSNYLTAHYLSLMYHI
ncbi:hypothetical protein BBAD15_m00018 (mitochondrion) [Beauveria bassiana D1-5]|uniref:Uncharacterized protein n=1 Tax=Beauveria bassiana D1-5 TaxID=1245745 RepID=A0A0A2V7C4_BEABA|nr:hypothetical protein BBAD15_m00018 [Beauveria bassiana D1-5]